MSLPFTGVTLNDVPLQTVTVLLVITGFGLTVTVAEKLLPVHAGPTGVTV
jgi:hypothetical protein